MCKEDDAGNGVIAYATIVHCYVQITRRDAESPSHTVYLVEMNHVLSERRTLI